MSNKRTFLVVSIVVATGAACGGSSSSPGGATDGSADGAGSGSGGSSSSSGSGTSSGDDASSGGSSGAASSSGASSSSGSGSSSGGISSGSSGADASSGGTKSDGGPDQIVCGQTVCDSLTQVCCATRTGRFCTTAAACRGDTLACSGTNSCAHGVCCEQLTGAGTIRTSCLARCPAGSPQLCTTAADCAATDVCRTGVDGYGVCRPAAPVDAGPG